jgi:hypothetical protein
MPSRSNKLLTSGRVAAVAGFMVAATVISLTGASATAGGPPGTTPALNTPHLALNTSSVQQIRQIVQCGSTMYAVGKFTTIKQGKQTYTRTGAFSFSANAPYKMTSWDPEIPGRVNTIGFNGTDCSHAYLGGSFKAVGSTAVKNLAEVSTSTGEVITSFGHSTNGQVETITGWNGHLLVGGYFTTINNSYGTGYLASLSPTTGRNDGYLNLGISGNYQYTDAAGNSAVSNPTRIYNSQLSHDGTRLLVEGDFTSIGGQPRRQVAMLDLGPNGASTDPWYPTEFNDNCAPVEPFYAQSAAWSADDSTVYVASTGYKPASGAGYSTSQPRAGLCDSAAAFPATSGAVTHTWINYTGCDSLYAAAADASTAYFGGHERWASNLNGCDRAGSGAVAAPGFVGLSPSSGAVTYNPGRARGLGADDMLVTSAGLWIASDNSGNADSCAGHSGYSGLCLLLY